MLDREIIEILRGYELAIRGNAERLENMSRIYQVLNDSHIDTQTRLERINSKLEILEPHVKKINTLEDRFNKMETSFSTALSIFKWLLPGGLMLNLIFQIVIWWANNFT